MEDNEQASNFLPQYKNYLIYCDDTGINKPYYGWGSLWIPSEARGRLSQWITELRLEHNFCKDEEIKWNGVSRRNRRFYEALVDGFFCRNWLMFHAIVVKKSLVKREFHEHMGQARLKHLGSLLTNKIEFFGRGRPDKAYHVRVDPLGAHSGYSKEDERLYAITNALLTQKLGVPAIHSLMVADSKKTVGIQLADVLLGAIVAPWQASFGSEHKEAISRRVFEHLGWDDHLADTSMNVWKFNIWHFYDPTSGVKRYVESRKVRFIYAPVAYSRK